nr:tigger transposable element-derived protein 1-like [Procambarus clarkii]
MLDSKKPIQLDSMTLPLNTSNTILTEAQVHVSALSSDIPSEAAAVSNFQVDPFFKHGSDDDTGFLSQKHQPYLKSKISTNKVFQSCNDRPITRASRCLPNSSSKNSSPVQQVSHLDTSSQSDVAHSSRLRKKTLEVRDENYTLFKRKSDQPNKSPKRTKMGECVGANICQSLESCVNRDLPVVKEEPIDGDDQEEDSVSLGGDGLPEDTPHSDDNVSTSCVGDDETSRDDTLHTHTNFTNFACKKCTTSEPCRPLAAALKTTTTSPGQRQAKRKTRHASFEPFEKEEREPYNTCHPHAVKEEQNMARKVISEDNPSRTVNTCRGAYLREMEDALYFWIQNQHRKNIPIDGTIIIEKATQLQAAIEKKNGASGILFSASSGWLRSFKKRHGLNITMRAGADHTIVLPHPAADHAGSHSAADSTAASSHHAVGRITASFSHAADCPAAPSDLLTGHTATPSHSNDDCAAIWSYPAQFAAIIKEGCYSPEQVFTVIETVLFWKRLPPKTFLMKEEKAVSGFKASNDYMTLLFCSNAAGDFKLPPLLVYRSLCPHELKNVFSLPVVWRANSKAWMTSAIFTDWYQHNFIPVVDKYLTSRNLPSKAILFVHSTPSHPQTLKGTVDGDGYRLEFFPPDTSSLLQSLDQGVIAQIKRLYTKQVLWDMLLYVEGKGNGRKGVVEFWKKFNIRNAISIITDSWETVDSPCLHETWEFLWSEIMSDFHGFLDSQAEISGIVKIANSIPGKGFDDLVAEDIMGHLESQCPIPTPDEVLELSTEAIIEGHNDDSEVTTSQMSLLAMRQFVAYMNCGLEIADSDPNFRRASVAARQIRKVREVYIRAISAQSSQKKMILF